MVFELVLVRLRMERMEVLIIIKAIQRFIILMM